MGTPWQGAPHVEGHQEMKLVLFRWSLVAMVGHVGEGRPWRIRLQQNFPGKTRNLANKQRD